MSGRTHLTRKEAAALCGCHVDTIRRNEPAMGNTRKRNGVVEVAVADLVAVGLLDPLAADNCDVAEVAGRSRAERDLVAARQELAVATALNKAFEERIHDYREENQFLRSALKQAVKN